MPLQATTYKDYSSRFSRLIILKGNRLIRLNTDVPSAFISSAQYRY